MSAYTTQRRDTNTSNTVKAQWERIGKGVYKLARQACKKHRRFDDDSISDTVAAAYAYHLTCPHRSISSVIYDSARTVCLADRPGKGKQQPELLGDDVYDVLATDDVFAPAGPAGAYRFASKLRDCTVRMPSTLADTALAIGTTDDCSQAAGKLGVHKGTISRRVKRMRELPCVTDLAIHHYGPYRALAVFMA